jgi:hypothetical protein
LFTIITCAPSFTWRVTAGELIRRTVQLLKLLRIDLLGERVGRGQIDGEVVRRGFIVRYMPLVEQRQFFIRDGIVADAVEQVDEQIIVLAVNLLKLDEFHLQRFEDTGAEEIRRIIGGVEYLFFARCHHRRKLVQVADEDQMDASEGTA